MGEKRNPYRVVEGRLEGERSFPKTSE